MSMPWFRWICVAMLTAWAASCGGNRAREPRREKPDLEPILGSIDAPVAGSTVRGIMLVGGWAIAESGVRRVAFYVDRQFILFAKVEGGRPDIEKLYGKDFPAAGSAGWAATVDTSPMADGRHELIVQVQTKQGVNQSLGPVAFQVAH